MATRWADQEDSDDEQQEAPKIMGIGGELTIPPTHKSRVDSKGIQIVTSYRLPTGSGQKLVKTITKQRVTIVTVKEHKAVQKRRDWKLFGQAAADAQAGTQTCVVSKEDIMIEDPHADADLKDEDPSNALSGNLNEFWAKQAKRQLQRKFDVSDDVGGDPDGGKTNNASASAWTQVKSNVQANVAAAGGKYVPPSARGGAPPAAGSSGPSFPDRRDDLNTIRVTNISPNVAEADLQTLFQRYGRISRVYLAKDKETLVSRGFAFVSFVSQSDAARAMEELQGHGYDHLILKLEWARPNNKDASASSGHEFRSGYGKALAQDTKAKVSYASNLTKGN